MLDKIILYGLVLTTLGLGAYCVVNPKSGKHGYIINQKVFDGFKGKIELEKKLNLQLKAHAHSLDSLQQSLNNDGESFKTYQDLKSGFAAKEQRLSEQYTADIWKEINRYVGQYGKEKGYDFIYGATGDGGLMYGSESVDLTEEMIIYINGAIDK